MSDISVMFGRPREGAVGDDRFDVEALALEELEIESYVIPIDAIVRGDVDEALRRLPRAAERTWLYRGWMLREEEYVALYDAIGERGETLVVDPESFAETTFAPNHLPLLGDRTPPARWIESDDAREAWDVAQELGPPPYVVKDWVKSAKEDWFGACFVPEAASFADFAAVCERLVELRGESFETGFVVKKYVELATLPGFTADRRRVTDEHRLLFWEGTLVAHAPSLDVDATLDDPSQFAFLGRVLGSPFFAADVGRLATGGWTVIEINDGGSCLLPEQLDPRDLYRVL